MDTPLSHDTPIQRPPAVWIICGGSLLLYIFAAVVSILYLLHSPLISAEFDWKWWIGLVPLEILGAGATWTLFQMRTVVTRWGAAILIFAAVGEIFNLLTGGAALVFTHPSRFIVTVVGDALEATLYAYSLHLRFDGMLRGPMPVSDRLRSPPPLGIAFVAGASAFSGAIFCITGAIDSLIEFHFSVGRGSAFTVMLGMAGAALAVSGIALWRKWKGARLLNALAAGSVALVWGANYLNGLAAFGLSLLCVRVFSKEKKKAPSPAG
jgi:hypothetical protein